MTAPAIFGIDSSGLNLAVNLVLLFLVMLWLALVYWTYSDAKRRIADPMLIGCATAASLFPFVGTIIYLVVRPPEYLEDARERELEIRAAEARLSSLEHHRCPHCDGEVERSFLRCPSCLRKLKDPCASCGKPLDPAWKLCPYCEAEVVPPSAATAAARRPSRRRRAPAGGEATAAAQAAAPAVADSSAKAASADPSTGERRAARRAARAKAAAAEVASEPPPAGRRATRRAPRAADPPAEPTT